MTTPGLAQFFEPFSDLATTNCYESHVSLCQHKVLRLLPPRRVFLALDRARTWYIISGSEEEMNFDKIHFFEKISK